MPVYRRNAPNGGYVHVSVFLVMVGVQNGFVPFADPLLIAFLLLIREGFHTIFLPFPVIFTHHQHESFISEFGIDADEFRNKVNIFLVSFLFEVICRVYEVFFFCPGDDKSHSLTKENIPWFAVLFYPGCAGFGAGEVGRGEVGEKVKIDDGHFPHPIQIIVMAESAKSAGSI